MQPKSLVPHTPEWFRWLSERSPFQAGITRALVERAGKTDICTFCGDDVSEDYMMSDGSGFTARLCRGCLKIRKAMYGEDWVPRNAPKA